MKVTNQILFLLCLSFQFVPVALGQSNDKLYLSADSLNKYQRIQLSNMWKYHRGNDNTWANADFDDSEWQFADTGLEFDNMPPAGWTGTGWFRLHLTVDSTLAHNTIGLNIQQAGSSEIYLDGKLVFAFGDKDDHPTEISFDGKLDHTIAVRYSNAAVSKFHRTGFPAGFFLYLETMNHTVQHFAGVEQAAKLQMFFTALALAFGLLHLILYLFMPRSVGNLYYTIFLVAFAAGVYFDIQSTLLSTNFDDRLIYLTIHRALWAFRSIIFLRFVYAIFYEKLPRQFWIFLVLYVVFGTFSSYGPNRFWQSLVMLDILMILECFRIIFIAIKNKRDGAWIFASGFLILGFFSSYDMLLDLGLMTPIHEQTNAYFIGLIGLFIATSTYLARDIARTSQRILEQERYAREQETQQKILSAENERKSHELEEARKLQLSMIPKSVPNIPTLDIAAQMKTASEVGGDYYDFHLANDGTLTVAIGDATGHGMKAGNMVVSMKSLFNALPNDMTIPDFFNKCTRIIKSMYVEHLYMSMTMIRIKENKMIASAAGMPPILVYRDKTKDVEEILMEGMPLGHTEFPYQTMKTDLSPGDTILLMSDGFAELFNNKREMLGFPRVREYFRDAARKSPGEIIKHLFEAGEKWSEGSPQNDDMTFVALQIK